MRKLATIQKISSLTPIEGADKIEVAHILGWHVVVKKNEFQVGDLCVYFEVDSFLPVSSQYEFLRKSCYRKLSDGQEGFRLRTIKLRGQISQGLALPLSNLNIPSSMKIGEDLTSLLGVTKYEAPIPAELTGEVLGPFPNFLFKTDEMRIQNVPLVLSRHKGKEFVATEKLDGTSCTIYKRNDEFGVCSRSLNLKENDTNTFWKIAKNYQLKEKLKGNKNIAIQGEVIGENIQSNKYKLRGQDLFVFNIFDIDQRKYLDFYEMKNICEQLHLKMVPFIETFILDHTVDSITKKSQRHSLLYPTLCAEGIVCRPLKEGYDEELGRLSFKAINPDFLLKFD